jgi:hypothetical protein
MDIYSLLIPLKGKTLSTLKQNKKFTILDVSPSLVIILVHERHLERKISMDEIEDSWRQLVTLGELTRVDIRDKHSNFNPAYVAAILAQFPGVRHVSVPTIKLYYR